MVRRSDRFDTDATRRLAELLGTPVAGVVQVRRAPLTGIDLLVEAGGNRLAVQFRSAGTAACIVTAADQIGACVRKLGARTIPLVAVPFMGEVGRRLCMERRLGWFDLSGNAHILAPGLRIHVEGKPNRFKRLGRPSTVFAPRSSRIARCLLLDPARRFTQRELATATGLGEGYVSRIVRRMVEDQLLIRGEDGTVQPEGPAKLLDSWWEEYDFTKHRVLSGHVPARTQEELVTKVSRVLDKARVRVAVTGLAAAWVLTHFASYRIATFYVGGMLDDSVLEKVEFREDDRGANVWFVEPNDEGVFHGAAPTEGVSCVSAVQAYMDLKGHPERAKEAAEELRRRLLPWARHV